MEFLDILDANGQPTGIVKSRDEAHRDGDWHKTVHIAIFNSKNELLLQKRAPAKESYANLWDISVAGHVEAGADATTAALRELSEELGLKIDPKNLQYLFTVKESALLNNGTFHKNEFHDIFLLRMDLEIADIKLQKEEVAEIKFFNLQELEKSITKNQQDYVPHGEEYRKLFLFLKENANQ